MSTSVPTPSITYSDAGGVSGFSTAAFDPDDRFKVIRDRLEAPDWEPSGRAVGAALGTSRVSFSKHDREHWRLVRFHRRQRSSGWLVGAAREAVGLDADSLDGSDWVRPARPARCRWRVAPVVGVHAPAGDHGAHFSGLERCGSIWACPVCSAVIRAARADEIGRALEHAHEAGCGLAFVTLTLRHREADELTRSLDLLMEAWRKVQRWKGWRDLRENLGIRGFIRSTEVTYGGSGWHPHTHLAIVFDRPLSELERAQMGHELTELWRRAVSSLGGRLPSREHGVDVRLADGDGVQIADYLGKVQEHVGKQRRGIAKELARGDLKTGRAGSVTPFELLDAEGPGSGRARTLWVEYVTGTSGRRAFSWSRGLRDELLPDDEEQTDEEIIEDVEQADLIAIINAVDYDGNVKNRPEVLAAILEAAEAGDFEMIDALATEKPPPKRRHGPRFT